MSIMYNMVVKRGSSSSSTNITHLSDDVLSEIFRRLPFRSTSRCKFVSKKWLSVVSKPSFNRLFMNNQINAFFTLLVFLSPQRLMLAFPPTPFDDNPHHEAELKKKTLLSPGVFIKEDVCGCSKNVLLCSNSRHTWGQDFFLCDPLTKETLQVPSLETREGSMYAVGFICADPFYNNNNNNLTALDPKRCFRLVLIRSFVIRHFEFEVDVWYSEIGKWNTHLVRCRNGFAFGPHCSLSSTHEGSLYFMGRTSIFVYDPFSYKAYTLYYPQGTDPMNIMSFGFLGSTCGKLRISDIRHSDLRIWELLDDKNWELVYHVDFTDHLPVEFCNNYHKKVGGFHPHNGEIVYLHSYAEGIFVANLETIKFTVIPGYENSDLSSFQLEVPFFPPSTDQE